MFLEMIHQTVPQFAEAQLAAEKRHINYASYLQFQDDPLILLNTAYYAIPVNHALRGMLMHKWGIRSLQDLTPARVIREERSLMNHKISNELIYRLEGGIYLCHNFRSKDTKCNSWHGDWDLVKFSPLLIPLVEGWLQNVPSLT